MVGSGDAMDAALKVALDRCGLFVETVALEGLEDAVHLTAPDVILLVGDAAREGGLLALTMLAGDTATAAVPVVLLTKDRRLESRMHAFRHGAVAVVPRSASADAIARRVVQLQRELSEPARDTSGEIGEATFETMRRSRRTNRRAKRRRRSRISSGWRAPARRSSRNGVKDLRVLIGDLNPVLRGWRNYFGTGNAAKKFNEIDSQVWWRLKRFKMRGKGRHLRGGEANRWTREYFEAFGLHRLRGTVRYPGRAFRETV